MRKPDGTLTANGFTAEFRLLYEHPHSPGVYRVVTAAGEMYAFANELTWHATGHDGA